MLSTGKRLKANDGPVIPRQDWGELAVLNTARSTFVLSQMVWPGCENGRCGLSAWPTILRFHET